METQVIVLRYSKIHNLPRGTQKYFLKNFYLAIHDFSAYADSDTGFLEDPKASKGRKTRRKRTTNLGPRLKVLNINNIESGLKVECQMDTAKQKTITFEFSTVDFVPEDISNEFVKEDLLPQAHRDILIEQLNDIVRQLKEDSSKIPVVHFPPEQVSSSSPNRDGNGKKAVVVETSASNEQSSLPSSPAKKPVQTQAISTTVATEPATVVTEVKKSRFTILPISATAESQTPDSNSPGVVQQPPFVGQTPQTGMTPDSTIHGRAGNPPTEKYIFF